jgi:hypothetical protein
VFAEADGDRTASQKRGFPIGQSFGHEFVYPAGNRQLGQGTK